MTVGSVGQTLFMINADQIVLNAHRAGRACLDAHLARDASDLAKTPYRLPRIMGTAGNPDPSFQGHQFDHFFRTGADAGATADTFYHIDYGKLILYGNGAEGAGCHAVP